MPGQKSKTIFLTGATSGIGLATAQLLTSKGYKVFGTGRLQKSVSGRQHFHFLEMHLENVASIQDAWSKALGQSEQIDIVIQNAGAGIFGAIEDVLLDDARRQWQILVEGPMRLLQLAAEHLRPRREGLIIGVSSLAAELPMPFSAHYSAGKAAFSALLAGLSMELKPFGIRVVDLRPGDIRTSFNDQLPRTMPVDSAYLPWSQTTWQKCASLMAGAPLPTLVANRICDIIEAKNPAPLARIGTFFQATMGTIGARVLPQARLLDSIRRYYGLHQIDEREKRKSSA